MSATSGSSGSGGGASGAGGSAGISGAGGAGGNAGDTGNSTGAQIADRLGALIDKITGAAPNALLVVAKITPVSWASSVVTAYNNAIPGLVQTRVAAGKHVLVADMNTGFNSATMMSSDNLHPNNAGYKFMASRWYAVVGPLFR